MKESNIKNVKNTESSKLYLLQDCINITKSISDKKKRNSFFIGKVYCNFKIIFEMQLYLIFAS